MENEKTYNCKAVGVLCLGKPKTKRFMHSIIRQNCSKFTLKSNLKGKTLQLQSSWGSMLGLAQNATDHAQHNPLK
jgi:hypothetical protein